MCPHCVSRWASKESKTAGQVSLPFHESWISLSLLEILGFSFYPLQRIVAFLFPPSKKPWVFFVPSKNRGVPHISLVFREMWETTTLNVPLSKVEKEVKVRGLPHLAKNERDMGHPRFLEGTNPK